ncbi:MAG: hypothetical protein UW28_C0003G0005 [Parcubacteria group bacterium GW2011_GWA2_44_13]|nr:MAG: hypothetical protein UW28_C0003G0005 [Parcubacteria group bacterium GW2011_GWA2_44_13]
MTIKSYFQLGTVFLVITFLALMVGVDLRRAYEFYIFIGTPLALSMIFFIIGSLRYFKK